MREHCSNKNIWIKCLKNTISGPFTTKQAYEAICNSIKKNGGRRTKVPSSTNQLSQILRGSKQIKRVNPKCDTKKYVALWDFID